MNNYLDSMRGETSSPLQEAILSALTQMVANGFNFFSVQMPSQRLTKGVSLIVRSGDKVQIKLFYARSEMGGSMPPQIFADLTGAGWQISADVYGQKYVGVTLSLTSVDFNTVANIVCHALEKLGVPQRKKWKLNPDFKLIK